MSATDILHRAGLLAAVALIALSIGGKPAAAAGTDDPPPPAPSGDKKDEKKSHTGAGQSQQLADRKFLDGYRVARAKILAGDYQGGIAAMHALGRDDHPDVANYIGYADRKLGKYDDSKFWYEKALAADPKHVRTWSYYGMWHAEQGDLMTAFSYLQRVKALCGVECKEYRDLQDVIEGGGSY